MFAVGLTGGFGTGKTTVLGMFRRLGAVVLSADTLVHREWRTNRRLQARLRRHFGEEIFVRGKLDAGVLARKAFSDPRELAKLNSWVHPRVRRRILDFMALCRRRPRRVLVVEVPLLFETGYERLFDATVAVSAPSETVRRRLSRKNRFSAGEERRRRRFQYPLKRKIARSDFVIDNAKGKVHTRNQVINLMGLFRRIA